METRFFTCMFFVILCFCVFAEVLLYVCDWFVGLLPTATQ